MFLGRYKFKLESYIKMCFFALSNQYFYTAGIIYQLDWTNEGNVLNNIILTVKHQYQSRAFEDIKGKGNDIILESS